MKGSAEPARLHPQLDAVYRDHETAVAALASQAVCGPGCAFCCTHYGRVDTLTLEALRIHDWLAQRPLSLRRSLGEAIERGREAFLARRPEPCPFLGTEKTCRIYAIRPFACRRLYSVSRCSEGVGPTLHRQAHSAGETAVRRLQKLDADGYTGHLTAVLSLMGQKAFLADYRSGRFDPARIQAFGRTHGLFINRMAASPSVRKSP